MASNQSVIFLNTPSLTPETGSKPTSSLQQAGVLLVFSSTALAVGITALRLYAKGKTRQFWWGKCVARPSLARTMELIKSPWQMMSSYLLPRPCPSHRP